MNNELKIYAIKYPILNSYGEYNFKTDSGLLYEVCFGRKKDDIFHVIIVFGVKNDEYQNDEYPIVNKGEIYKVMNTIVEIVKHYIANHPNVNKYEFYAMEKSTEAKNKQGARMKLYQRYLPKIFDTDIWTFDIHDNSAMVINNSRAARN